MTRHPLALASCATMLPTAPAAADTNTVSPGATAPTSVSPKYAVIPGIPSAPSHVSMGARSRSSRDTPAPSDTAYSHTPNVPLTTSPTA